MNKKPIIAANWKMNLSGKEAQALALSLVKKKEKLKNYEVILFVSFLQIESIAKICQNSGIGVGGQNVHNKQKGAYTGEISADQLQEVGCSHVLISHSERRHYFHEDYKVANEKIQRSVAAGLKVVLCVGESLEERENNITEAVVVDQIVSAFEGVDESELGQVSIVYEPIWAIGCGMTPTTKDAAHVHLVIKKALNRMYAKEAVEDIAILYGGSVDNTNIANFLGDDNIDGVLVGKASIKVSSFMSLITSANKAKAR